jgi:hypothetical protein
MKKTSVVIVTLILLLVTGSITAAMYPPEAIDNEILDQAVLLAQNNVDIYDFWGFATKTGHMFHFFSENDYLLIYHWYSPYAQKVEELHRQLRQDKGLRIGPLMVERSKDNNLIVLLVVLSKVPLNLDNFNLEIQVTGDEKTIRPIERRNFDTMELPVEEMPKGYEYAFQTSAEFVFTMADFPLVDKVIQSVVELKFISDNEVIAYEVDLSAIK